MKPFGELIEAAKTRFPTSFDNDEVCRFFNAVPPAERERAFEYLSATVRTRAFPTRPQLVDYMKAIDIKVADSTSEEWGYEWVCKGCKAHRPIGVPLCPNKECRERDVSLARVRDPVRLRVDERNVTIEELAEFERFMKDKGYQVPAAVRIAERSLDRRMPYKDE